MSPILNLGDTYIFTAQIESIVWLTPNAVEIRTRSNRYMFEGTAAAALRTYLDSQAESFV